MMLQVNNTEVSGSPRNLLYVQGYISNKGCQGKKNLYPAEQVKTTSVSSIPAKLNVK